MIDGKYSDTEKYTSAGKGFMLNLCRDCHWNHVVVRNTIGTGFGMDCLIDCSIKNCIAENCGRGIYQLGKYQEGKYDQCFGGSGFGIGTGYSCLECAVIKNCISIGNAKYGFFFEHQKRFGKKNDLGEDLYPAETTLGYSVLNCRASGNLYGFGVEYGDHVCFQDSVSEGSFLEDIHLVGDLFCVSFSNMIPPFESSIPSSNTYCKKF